MNLDLLMGVESIAARRTSEFYDELTAIFQKAIDHKNTLVGKPKLVSSMLTYCESDVRKAVVDCVKKHTGITIAKFTFSQSPDCGFWMIPHFKIDMLKTIGIMKRVSGAPLGQVFISEKDYTKILPALSKMADSLDKEEGRFGITKAGKVEFTMSLNIDPFMSFMMQETINKNLRPLSAQEVTGIVLHEVGHAMSMLEHCADSFYRATTYQAVLRHAFESGTIDQKVDLLQACLEMIKGSHPVMYKTFYPALATAKALKADKQWPAIAEIAIRGLMLILNTVFTARDMLAMSIMEAAVMGEVQRDGMQTMLEGAVKKNDLSGTIRNLTMIERWADEFETLHGGASYGVTALAKIVAAAHYTQLGPSTSTFMRNSTIAYYASLLPSILQALIYGDMACMGNQYDGVGERDRRMMLTSIALFKDKGMPKPMLDRYIEDYERLIVNVNNQSLLAKVAEWRHKLNTFLNYWASPITLIAAVSSGKFDTDYRKLVDHLEELGANPLFFQAAKLNQLARKR